MRHKATLLIFVICGIGASRGDTPARGEESAGGSSPICPAVKSSSQEPLSLAQRVLIAEASGDLEERSRLVLDLLEQDQPTTRAADAVLRHSLAAAVQDRGG